MEHGHNVVEHRQFRVQLFRLNRDRFGQNRALLENDFNTRVPEVDCEQAVGVVRRGEKGLVEVQGFDVGDWDFWVSGNCEIIE